MKRTIIKDSVNQVGEEVLLQGWVHRRRNMGKMVFIDLRDATGICQVVFLPNHVEALTVASDLGHEDVITLKGKVNARPPKQVKADQVCGSIEIEALELTIINKSAVTPFEVNKDTSEVGEELRLKYRYLDLRSERMAKNLKLRHTIAKTTREFFYEHDFTEIETPVLTKSTPEGARDFLVPSRNYPGNFYALPQSPQQYKQLLMLAGMERYFQIAKCFRDEDARGDRQVEFTQIDAEMSFVNREMVMELIEKLVMKIIQTVAPEKTLTFTEIPRLDYAAVMKEYGIDRPDLRKDKTDKNELALAWVINFPFFEKTDQGGWTFTHNPFSAAIPEHEAWLNNKEHLGEILTTQYDLVLNGFEIGGGSIRNHQPELLKRVLEILGYDEASIMQNFGHMMEAFSFGAPPHGGIAFGLDRLVAILAGETGIRDVIAFPKTLEGRDPMMDSPSPATAAQLAELKLSNGLRD